MQENIIKYSKAKKMKNFKRPKYCPNCNKILIPELHLIILREYFWFNVRMARLYTDTCECCNYEFEYWS